MELSVRAKFSVMFAIMLTGLGLLAYFSAAIMESEDEALTELSGHQLQAVLQSRDNRKNFSGYLKDVEFALSTNEIDPVADNAEIIDKIVSSIDHLMEADWFADRFRDSHYKTSFPEFHKVSLLYVTTTVKGARLGNQDGALELKPEAIAKLRNDCLETLSIMERESEISFQQLVSTIRKNSASSKKTYPLAVLAAALFMLLASYAVGWPILQRIQSLKIHFASADPESLKRYEGRVYEDELGTLVSASNKLIERIQESRTHLVAKELMDKVFDTLLDILIVTDKEGRIIRSNSVAEELLGLSKMNLESMSAFDLFIPPGPGGIGVSLDLEKVVHAGASVAESSELLKSNGKILPVFVALEPMYDKAGEYIGTVISAKDMTQTLVDQQEKITIQAQLTQASKLASLGTLGAGVAHELNNPLVGVRGFADLILTSSDSSSRIRDWAQKIVKTSMRMQKIINHLRSFATDTTENEWTDLAINSPITDSLIIFQSQLAIAAIDVELNLEDNLPMVNGDHNQLESIFQNLISNSRDAFESSKTPAGVRNISFRSHSQDGNVIVTYSDTAGGIPKNVIARIFDPFFTTKDVGKGTGLGLSISHTIVKEHGGKIDVASVLNVGSTFTISLPISTANIHEEFLPSGSEASKIWAATPVRGTPAQYIDASIAKVIKKPNILVVDDEDIILEVVEGYLAARANLAMTTDSYEALEHVLSGNYDLLITDIKMPKMNGLELISKIRKKNATIPIIVMTEHAQSPQQVREAIDVGANIVVPKPLPPGGAFAKIVFDILDRTKVAGIDAAGMAKVSSTGKAESIATSAVKSGKPSAEPSLSSPAKKPNILVLDDEDIVLDVVDGYLATHANLAMTTDSSEALEQVLTGNYDLLITDIKMPKMDGLELISKIREKNSTLPIVVMTGHAQSPQEVQEVLGIGANIVVPKPLPPGGAFAKIIFGILGQAEIGGKHAADPVKPSAPRSQALALIPPAKKLTILVVDDEEIVLEVVEGYLSDHAHLSMTTSSAEALEHALTGNYDLIVTDIRMPTMDGMELISKIRLQNADVPIIAITGHAQSSTQVRAVLDVGANLVVPKPLPSGTGFADLILDVIARAAAAKAESDMIVLTKPRILIVDDEEFILELMGELLSAEFIISTAENFIEASKIIADGSFDLIMSDYSLGAGHTGLDILDAVKGSKRPETPTIIMTGEDPRGPHALECLNRGAIHILEKPFGSQLALRQLLFDKISASKLKAVS
jgi:PAS domain S-box-containing protein